MLVVEVVHQIKILLSVLLAEMVVEEKVVIKMEPMEHQLEHLLELQELVVVEVLVVKVT